MTHHIKRYSNRRLYDTTASRTITHSDLKRLIEQGEKIQITESSTGKDITVESLARLVANQSVRWRPDQARQKFETMIAEGGKLSMSILRNTALASIGAFNVTRKKAEEVIDRLIASGEVTKSQRKEAILELLDRAEKSTEEFRQKAVKQAGKLSDEVQKAVEKYRVAKKDDVDALNKKFDKLLKAVEKLEKKIEATAPEKK